MLPTDLVHLIFTFLQGLKLADEVNRCREHFLQYAEEQRHAEEYLDPDHRLFQVDYLMDLCSPLGEYVGGQAILEFQCQLWTTGGPYVRWSLSLEYFLPETGESCTWNLATFLKWVRPYRLPQEFSNYFPRALVEPTVTLAHLVKIRARKGNGPGPDNIEFVNLDMDGMAGGTFDAAEALRWYLFS